jgi:hypothetical protein
MTPTIPVTHKDLQSLVLRQKGGWRALFTDGSDLENRPLNRFRNGRELDVAIERRNSWHPWSGSTTYGWEVKPASELFGSAGSRSNRALRQLTGALEAHRAKPGTVVDSTIGFDEIGQQYVIVFGVPSGILEDSFGNVDSAFDGVAWYLTFKKGGSVGQTRRNLQGQLDELGIPEDIGDEFRNLYEREYNSSFWSSWIPPVWSLDYYIPKRSTDWSKVS